MSIEDGLFVQDKPEQKNNKDTKDEKKDKSFVTKEMIRGAELKQLQEQKRSGKESVKDLPGENN